MSEAIEVESAGVKLGEVEVPRLREDLRVNKIKLAEDLTLRDLVGLLVAHYDGQKKQGIEMCECDRCNGVAPEALPACPFCGEPNESPGEGEVDLTSAPSASDETADTFPDLPRVTPKAIERARAQSEEEEDEGPSDAYPTHEAAGLFPMLPPEELKKLAEDIAANGLRDAIVTYRGQVLDGRNRLAACRLANVEPVFAPYDGDDPFGYVLSANLHRRHLTTSQRAAVAVDMKRLLQGGAKERQQATRAKPGEKVGSKVRAFLPEPCERPRERAAKALNVSERSVQDAAAVALNDPKLFERIKRGETTVGAASKITAGERKKEKPKQKLTPAEKMKAARHHLDRLVKGTIDTWPGELRTLVAYLKVIAARVEGIAGRRKGR